MIQKSKLFSILAVLSLLLACVFTVSPNFSKKALADDLSTSSSYLFGPSTNENLLPYSGFGVDTILDSCLSFPQAITDIGKITNLLQNQISKVVRDYFSNQCNISNSFTGGQSDYCNNKVKILNNLLISYTTYKIESYKVFKDYSLVCSSTNKPIGGDKKDWSNVDLTAMAYASVRDAYITHGHASKAGFTKTLGLIISKNFNQAYINNNFVDASSSTQSIQEIAKSFLSSVSAANIPVISNQNITLSSDTPFYIFGLTDNLNFTGQPVTSISFIKGKTITAMAFNSLQEYSDYFNQNPVAFSDMYDTTANSSFLTNSVWTLDNLQYMLLSKIGNFVDLNTVSFNKGNEINNSSQKASVLESMGGWLKSLWTKTEGIFKNIFGVKDVGAAISSKASGSGSSTSQKYSPRKMPRIPPAVKKEPHVVCIPIPKDPWYKKFWNGRTSSSDAILRILNTPGLTPTEIEARIGNVIEVSNCHLSFFGHWEF
ncbi:MAG: hypothetical protein WCO09_02525 [bacterium]